jgi:hypothetical protein
MKARHAAAAALALAGGYLTVLVGTRRWHQHWGGHRLQARPTHAITHPRPSRTDLAMAGPDGLRGPRWHLQL